MSLTHGAGHALTADEHAVLPVLCAYPGHATGRVGVQVNLANALCHHRNGDAAWGWCAFAPGLEPDGRDREDAAHPFAGGMPSDINDVSTESGQLQWPCLRKWVVRVVCRTDSGSASALNALGLRVQVTHRARKLVAEE